MTTTGNDTLDSHARHVIMTQADAMKRGALVMWTVYDRPKDYPDDVVARMYEVGAGKITATDHVMKGEGESLRAVFLRAGLTRLARDPDDDANIMECWV